MTLTSTKALRYVANSTTSARRVANSREKSAGARNFTPVLIVQARDSSISIGQPLTAANDYT